MTQEEELEIADATLEAKLWDGFAVCLSCDETDFIDFCELCKRCLSCCNCCENECNCEMCIERRALESEPE